MIFLILRKSSLISVEEYISRARSTRLCASSIRNIVGIFCLLGKETFQACRGIKGVIVVTDDGIAPCTHIQAHFKGTDIMLLSIGEDHITGDGILLGQQIIHGIIDPVKMTQSSGACLRVALGLI